ncbi:MAG: ribonuclease R [Bacteroidales bacterium]|nr:ribonuclease R [Bacteroidales bacterium]
MARKNEGRGRKPVQRGKARISSGRGRRNSPKVIQEYEGRVQMTREGYIFVIVDGMDGDVFVKASKTRNALDGDIVKVAVTKGQLRPKTEASASGNSRQGRSCEGEVVSIVERSKRQFVGYMHLVGAQAWVLMQSKSMPYDIEVDLDQALGMGARKGMKVAAVVDGWYRKDICPHGHIVDVLGMPGENDTEMHAILAEFGLPYRFEKEVENAADSISDAIGPEELKGRKDFRGTLTFTIDPADAKDFDDALSFRRLENGNYEVGVHIADVSYYVKPGDPVDREARERGTSVYLVDRTVPMLPETLCNKLCSLRPHEDKLTFSAVFEISPKAEIKSRWMGRTVINSDYRFDYDQAQAVILSGVSADDSAAADAAASAAGNTPPDLPADIVDAILTLNGIASKLREKRFRMGAVNFDRPEMKVEVDANGKPVRIYEKVTFEANWLIEEFMLLANRTVAEIVATGGKFNAVASPKAKAFVYRIHDEPNTEKLYSLRDFAGGFGYKMGDALQGREAAKTLNALLEQAKGKPECAAFEDIALRSMAKACYSAVNIGHYGLAFDFYTHFTSPIRRYPDLMVHRLLARYLAGGESAEQGKLEVECQHASEREQIAADAERTSTKYKLVEYMQDKIGLVFDGSVSGVTEWGMYVQIEPTHIEGMVSLRDIHSDFFEFDEKHYRLVGRRTRRQYRLGDPVKIRVKEANLDQRLLDFELVEE